MGEENRMKDVYFFTDIKKLKEAVEACGIQDFVEKEVLVKLHMGEPGNKYFPQPSFVKKIIEQLQQVKASPFLYDTTVCYNSPRNDKDKYLEVAEKHGFSQETMDCDIIIDGTGMDVTMDDVSFTIGSRLYECDHIFAISHVKGHNGTGMGGAIKNFGMGGVTKETKKWIHTQAKPMYHKEKCTFCGRCAEVCPFKAITIDNDEWVYNTRRCFGCDACVQNCPTNALEHQSGHSLQYLIACAAKASLKDKKVIYLNELKRISQNCDCDPLAGPIICPDIGYLVSTDPVAIDAASLDLIYGKKPDIFKKETNIDPIDMVKYGEEIRLGTSSYRLVEL